MLRGIALLLMSFVAAAPGQGLAYTVRRAPATRHDVEVELKVRPVDGAVVLRRPAFVPGRPWSPRDRAPVSRITATVGGAPAVVTPTEEGVWTIRTSDAVTVTWRVSLPEKADAWGYLGDEGGVLDPASFLLFTPDLFTVPCSLTFDFPSDWKVVGTLPREGRTVAAKSVAELLRALLFVGPCQEWALGDQAVLVLDGAGTKARPTSVLDSVAKLVAATAITREAERPYVILCLKGARGGRAFRHGAIFGIDVDILDPLRPARAFAEAWAWQFTGGVTGPRELRNADFTGPVASDVLWFREGVAAWLVWRALLGAERIDTDAFLDGLREPIVTARNHPVRPYMTLEEASRTVWERGGFEARGISPKLLGFLAAAQLDLLLRTAKKPTTLKALVADLPEACPDGYDGKDLRSLVVDRGGEPLALWWDRHVTGKDEVPWAELLGAFGLKLEWYAWKVADPGVRFVEREGHLIVTEVDPRGCMAYSEVAPADVIQEVNRRAVHSVEDFDELVSRLTPGDKLRLDGLREGRPRTFRAPTFPGVALEVFAETNADDEVELLPPPPGVLRDAGLEGGDVLYKIGKRRIHRLRDLPDALARLRPGVDFITVERDRQRKRFRIELPPHEIQKARLSIDPDAPPEAVARREAWLGSR